MLNGIDYGVQFSLVNKVAADGQGDGSYRHRINNGAKTTLLTVHDKVGVGFRNDSDAAIVINNLNQDTHTASLKETFISKLYFREIPWIKKP